MAYFVGTKNVKKLYGKMTQIPLTMIDESGIFKLQRVKR